MRVPGLRSGTRSPSMTRLAGFGWAGLSVVIFSGWFVVTRFSVTRELGVWDITALRFGIGACVLAPALLRRGASLPAAAWRDGFVFMVLWGLPFVLLVAAGLRLTSAAEAASIAPTLMPVFTAIFAAIFLREALRGRALLGHGAILVGLVCLVAAGRGVADPVGIGVLVLAAAMWAVYTLLFRRSALTPLQSAALICIWSALLFVPAYWWFGLSRLHLASTREILLQGFYQGVLMSGVAVVTFNRAVSLLGPIAATAVIAMIPATASLLAIPVLAETPTPAQAAAISLVVGGVLLAARPVPPATPQRI